MKITVADKKFFRDGVVFLRSRYTMPDLRNPKNMMSIMVAIRKMTPDNRIACDDAMTIIKLARKQLLVSGGAGLELEFNSNYIEYEEPDEYDECTMLGINSNSNINPTPVLEIFFKQSSVNRDGVGVGYYQGDKAIIHKQAKAAHQSPLAQMLLQSDDIRSQILISHLRNASPGYAVNFQNTHPWRRECNGIEYMFCLNGRMGEAELPDITLKSLKPAGGLPAEKLFCLFLEQVHKRQIKNWSHTDFEWAHSFFLEMNKLASMNILLSTPSWLLAYHDREGFNSLYYNNRQALDSNAPNPTSMVSGVVVSTLPLTESETWDRVSPGQMLVFEDGEIAFNSCKNA